MPSIGGIQQVGQPGPQGLGDYPWRKLYTFNTFFFTGPHKPLL